MRRLEAGSVDPGIAEDPSGLNGGLGGDRPASRVFRFSRDPAVDHSTPQGYASVGLAGNPDPPTTLGAQSSELSAGSSTPGRTRAGRPGRFVTALFNPRSRDLSREERGTLAPGTIRRNIRYPINGIPVPGLFSWAANEPCVADTLDPTRPPQDEYLVSSVHLQLPDSLATVVSGTTKRAPGLEPFRGGATIQAGPSTGYPVVAPQIPSYGSRVPLRRPRGLVTVGD